MRTTKESGKSERRLQPFVLSTSQPAYQIDNLEGLRKASADIEQLLIGHAQGRIGIRAISLFDHPGVTLSELVETIIRHGTDRYDPDRRNVCHDYYALYGVETHVLPCLACDKLTSTHCEDILVIESILLDFVEGPPVDRGYESGLRIDLLLIYDLDQLIPVQIQDEADPTREPCEYRFKYPTRKQDSLLGLVQVLT